jgi:dolichol-phosphate mannosyltransferase
MKTWVVLKALPELENYTGYVFQVALLDNTIKSKAIISQIPIQFKDRTEGYSKINSVQYIIQALLYVITNSSFVKFGIVGLIGFAIDFLISYFFIEMMHSQVWIGTLISTETALISNFLLNNFWSFAHKKISRGKGNYVWSFIKFNLISSGSILIQTLGVSFAAHYFGRDLWFVYKALIIAFIIIPYSYFFYTKFIWKDK